MRHRSVRQLKILISVLEVRTDKNRVDKDRKEKSNAMTLKKLSQAEDLLMKKTKATSPATKIVAITMRMAASLPALSHKLDI